MTYRNVNCIVCNIYNMSGRRVISDILETYACSNPSPLFPNIDSTQCFNMKYSELLRCPSHRITMRPEGYLESEPLKFVSARISHYACWPHRNNRHRMRAPIFSQSKICLHKMAHSKGHFYSVQTPVARNFARLRGVRLFFQTQYFKKFKKRD